MDKTPKTNRGALAVAIGFSALGIVFAIVAFLAVWAGHKEKQAMKGITYHIEYTIEGKNNQNLPTSTQH